MNEIIELNSLVPEPEQPKLFTYGFIAQFSHAVVNNKLIVKEVILTCEMLRGSINHKEVIHVMRKYEDNTFIKVGEIPSYTLKIYGKPERQVSGNDLFAVYMDNATSRFRGEVAMGDYLVVGNKP